MRRKRLSTIVAIGLLAGLAGCGAEATSTGRPEPSVAPRPTSGQQPAVGSSQAHSELIGRAAAAIDKHFTADYQLTRGSAEPVEVAVTIAKDGTWRVDIPGGAQGGKADVTIAWNRQGYYQCVQDSKAVCASIADRDGEVPRQFDPLVQHVFTDWLKLLLDRGIPLSVSHTDRLPGAGKSSECYALDKNSVTVSAPMPSGTYCLREDGTITAVKSSFGKLKLAGDLMPAPAKIELPGEVADADPLSTSAPPKPTPTKSKDPDPKKSD